ncbi:metallophosphoesterase [Candidatus Darwinibacter acetoxidans]
MKRCLAFGVLVLLLFLSSAAPGRVLAQEELVVLHTNDLHGQSLARLATVLEEQRREHSHLFWVDAGDLFSGSPVSSAFQGEAEEQSGFTKGIFTGQKYSVTAITKVTGLSPFIF